MVVKHLVFENITTDFTSYDLVLTHIGSLRDVLNHTKLSYNLHKTDMSFLRSNYIADVPNDKVIIIHKIILTNHKFHFIVVVNSYENIDVVSFRNVNDALNYFRSCIQNFCCVSLYKINNIHHNNFVLIDKIIK